MANKSFTLLELLVVTATLGVLSIFFINLLKAWSTEIKMETNRAKQACYAQGGIPRGLIGYEGCDFPPGTHRK